MLFEKELDKVYNKDAPEDDMKERSEEMERMREHVFKESDIDRNNLISFEEFLSETKVHVLLGPSKDALITCPISIILWVQSGSELPEKYGVYI